MARHSDDHTAHPEEGEAEEEDEMPARNDQAHDYNEVKLNDRIFLMK